MGQPRKLEKFGVFRSFAHAIGFLAGLVPALAHAQTNIDQGKSPAEIFANDCATCHKSTRGLANGRGTSGLASFLTEHYTASKDEAAAVAAYVMGAGGGAAPPAAAAGRGPKAAPDAGRAAVEEAHPPRESAKPDARAPATARLQPPGEEPKRPGDIPSILQEPGADSTHRPVASRRDGEPGAATRGRRKEPAASSTGHEPASGGGPAAQEAAPTPSPTAAAPANTDSGEGEPVPRDNIPD